MTTINVWPALGATVTLASGYIITAAGALAEKTDEIARLLRSRELLSFDPTQVNPNPSPIPPIAISGALVLEDVAALLAYPAIIPNQPATLLGYYEAGDGGGGDFIFYLGDSTTADGGTVFTSAFGLGRWKRILAEKNFRNVKWFGARGIDDTLGAYLGRDPDLSGPDDTAAIQAAWESMNSATWGAHLHFPAGNYKVTETLKFGPGNAAGAAGNYRITGEDATPGNVPGTNLLWYGPAIHPDGYSVPLIDFPVGSLQPAFNGSVMFQINGYGVQVERLSLGVAPQLECGCVVNIGYDQGTPPSGTNLVKFERCAITGGSPLNALNGTADYCVAFDIWRNPVDQNQEDCSFIQCNIGYAGIALVYFCATTQPYGTVFDRCYLLNNGMVSGDHAYGVGFWHSTDSLSLTVQDCDIQRVACHHMLNRLPQSMKLLNNHAEVYKKIVYAVWSGANDNNTLNIDNGRYNPDATGAQSYGPYTSWGPSDVDSIRITGDMGLNVSNTNFSFGSFTNAFRIAMNGGAIVSINNKYPNMEPFVRAPNYVPYSEAYPGKTFSFGDVGSDGGTSKVLPKLDGCINGAGLATISGAATFVDVNSSSTPAWKQEPNSTASSGAIGQTYRVRLSVHGVTGTPTVTTPYVSNLAYDGFRINLPTAPGVGNTVTVAYEPYRV